MSASASPNPRAWCRGRHPGLRGPAVRPMDIDLEAASIRIRTLKRRAEHWREIPVPPELLRALELVHALRSTPAKAASKPL